MAARRHRPHASARGLDILDPADHPAILDVAVRECLHPAFHDARGYYQFSNSCGLTTTSVVKVHLWYWLSAPVEDAHLRAVRHAHMPRIDYRLFNAVQPHFVAAPIVTSGDDPLAGHRLGWLRPDGAEAVELPALPPPVPRPKPPRRTAEQRSRRYSDDGDDDGTTPSGAAASSWLDDLRRTLGDGEGRLGFHEPLRRATVSRRTWSSVAGTRAQPHASAAASWSWASSTRAVPAKGRRGSARWGHRRNE